MDADAQRVIDYLTEVEFNSPQETAADCGLDEVGLDFALRAIEETEEYVVHKAVRRDSYGREVIWLEKA